MKHPLFLFMLPHTYMYLLWTYRKLTWHKLRINYGGIVEPALTPLQLLMEEVQYLHTLFSNFPAFAHAPPTLCHMMVQFFMNAS